MWLNQELLKDFLATIATIVGWSSLTWLAVNVCSTSGDWGREEKPHGHTRTVKTNRYIYILGKTIQRRKKKKRKKKKENTPASVTYSSRNPLSGWKTSTCPTTQHFFDTKSVERGHAVQQAYLHTNELCQVIFVILFICESAWRGQLVFRFIFSAVKCH